MKRVQERAGMKRLLKILIVIAAVILAKFCLVYGLNAWVVRDFDRGVYHGEALEFLKFVGFPETYVAYYNAGNIKLKTGEYAAAREEYERALSYNVPAGRMCDVRINLALAMIGGIDATNASAVLANASAVLADLASARKNLYQDDCAKPNSRNGRSVVAEDLEEEIIELEEILKEQDDSSAGDDSDDEDEDDSKEDSKDEEQNIKEQLREYSRDASSARQEGLTDAENLGGEYMLYSGKKW